MRATTVLLAVLLVGGLAWAEDKPAEETAKPVGATQTQPAAAATPSTAQPAATPPPAVPAPPPEPTFAATVPRITAGYQEKGGDVVIARNYVDFTYEKYRLQCDMLRYDVRTQEIEAEGNVVLEDKGQRLAGEKFHFSLKTNRGMMFEASGTAPPDLHFVSDEMHKVEDRTYRSKHGEFTSCTQPNPRWKISSSSAELELDDHLTLHNAIFKVKSVHVFYLPYMRYPIHKDDRSTGLLIPNYGHSSLKGEIFGEAFFWAINRSQDATFAYRSFSELGRGFESEYRYIYSNTSLGSMNFFYIFENKIEDDATNPKKDQNVAGTYFSMYHQQLLPWGVQNQTDIMIMTSYAFKQIYSSNFYNLNDPRKSSSTSFSKSLGYDSFNAQLRRDELLKFSVKHTKKVGKKTKVWYTEDSSIATYLPSVTYTHNQQKLGATPLYLYASGGFLGYDARRDETNTDTGKTTTDPQYTYAYNKFSWAPSISLPISAIPWVSFNPSFTYSGAYWSGIIAKNKEPKTGGTLLRNTFVSSLSIYGPNINRIFSTPGMKFSKKWKHSIEPRFDLYYNTKFEDWARIPEGDRDPIGAGGAQSIKYYLTNTLWGKRSLAPGMEASPVDILRWELSQTFTPNLDYVDPNTKKHVRFSDLRSNLTFGLSPWVNLAYQTDFDFNYRRFRDHQLNLGFAKLNLFNVNVGIMMSKDLKTGKTTSNSISSGGSVNLQKFGTRLSGYLNFNPTFEDDQFQAANITVQQDFQCWGVSVTFDRHRIYGQTELENAFYFSIHIGSIGTITQQVAGSRF